MAKVHATDGGRDARRAPDTEAAERLATGQSTLADFLGLGRERLYEMAGVAYGLMNSGKLEEALTIYRGLVAADPFDSVFRCHLGAAELRRGRAAEAAAEFTNALRFNRANADALSGRGEAYLRLGRPAEAVEDLRAAVKLDPHARRPSTVRARALLVSLRQAARRRRDQAS
ncbi:MAG TPA: tetratricopeptide repeat protein [Pyrinomonadaceae bacterium]|jgi:Flp pilus assembly protein TadD